MDDREERIVQRTSAKEKRVVTETASHDSEKGNNSSLHDELYFDQVEEFSPEGGEKFISWKGQRRGGAAHRYRSRWPSGRRMSRSFGRSRPLGHGSRREEDLDEGEIFELDAENLEENDVVLYDWGGGKRREFASDGSLFVEEYVLDDESLQADLQRYNTKYQRGRGGYSRPSSSRGRKSYERQRQYEKYEIIDEKTFGNYPSHSRMRSPHYRESENYREPFDSEVNPHGSREWSKRNWSRDDNSAYHKKSRSPDEHRSMEDKRYEREESGKQFYESRYHGKEEEGSPAVRRKGVVASREGESPAERRRRSPSVDKRDYSPLSPRDTGHGWRREPSSISPAPAHSQERSWSRNRRELSPPAAYKRRSPSPVDNRRAYSPNLSDKRESSPVRARVKEVSSPKKRGRSVSPHPRGRRDSSMSSGKRDHSVSPVGRKQGKSSSRKRERSPSPVPCKRGRSSSSSSSQSERSRSRSDSSRRESPGRGSDRDEPGSTYSGRASGRSRDPRRSASAAVGHASQLTQDAAWKQQSETSAQDYAAIQPQQQFGMETSGMTASSSALYPAAYSAYGAQPDMTSSAYHQAGHGGYDMYNYQAYYQQGAMQSAYGGEFAPHQMQPEWSEAGIILPDMSQPPPVQLQVQGSIETESEAKADLKKSEEARKEAIKKEQKEQKLTLIKQREEYYKKSSVLSRELELLREQKQELMEEKSCDNDRILKENGKLQLEIQNKLKAINNVIDMLTGIIGDKKDRKEEKRKSSKDEAKVEKHRSPDQPAKKGSEDEGEEEEDAENPRYNYVYYDPEVHWCRVCDVFPRTAKEYLHHLHSTEHKELTAKKKMVDMPWHKNKPEQEVAHHKGAPTKRTSIKGLQFLISVSSWYCKLCDSWIGDLHCVSLHLKSKLHLENYKEFVDKNPKWELEWLAEREEAFQRKNEETLLTGGPIRKDDSPMDFEAKVKEEPDSDNGREGKVSSKMVVKEKTKSTSGTWAEVVAAPPRTTRIPMTSALGGVAHRSKPRTVLGGDDSSESEEGEVKVSRSIRVSMRKKPQMTVPSETNRNSWSSVDKEGKGMMKIKVEESEEEGELQKTSRREEKNFQEWLPKAPAAISDDDRQLLSNIKDRLKQKQEAERERDEEREKPEEKERKSEREKYELKEKFKGDHERYDRGRSWDRDRSQEKDWYRERDRRERSRERKKGRSRRCGSISPRRRSSERRGRYEKKYDTYKERRRERDYRGDSRGERDIREEKMYAAKMAEEMEKKFDPFSKKEKKVEPKPPRVPKKPPPDPMCPKTKLPFIGRMPLLKHIAKKKVPGSGAKGDGDGKGGDLDQDGEGGVLSPSNDAGKESSIEEGKIEGVQDMDIDDDNSDGELPDSIEKDNILIEGEDLNESQDNLKHEGFDTSGPQSYSSVSMANATASAPAKVSRFGPLMEMSSGPKLLTSFDKPTGVQIQLCAPARLAPQAQNLLLPPGTTSESLPSAEGDAKPKTKVVDEIPLPKDFQDALNILFPEKSAMGGDGVPLAPPGVSITPPDVSDTSQDVNSTGMVHHVGMMAHGMPGMHPMDPSAHHMYGAPPPMHMGPPMHHQMAMAGPGGVLMANPMMTQPMEQQMQPMVQEGDESMVLAMQEQNCVSEEMEPEPEPEASPEKVVRRKYVEMGEDELAMLGIDPEDMAAQTFAPKRPYP